MTGGLLAESQSGANRPIVDARLEKLTDDDDIDGTKPNESDFELNFDELGPGTLQCPETRKVKKFKRAKARLSLL